MDLLANIDYYIFKLAQIYTYVIIAYVLLSWLPNARESVVGVWLARIVEPYLYPFRKLIPPIGGVLDLSPFVALLALNFVAQGIVAVLQFIFGLFV